MGRFFVTWLTIAAASGVFIYLFSKQEKIATMKMAQRVAICAGVGLVGTLLMLGINMMQGL